MCGMKRSLAIFASVMFFLLSAETAQAGDPPKKSKRKSVKEWLKEKTEQLLPQPIPQPVPVTVDNRMEELYQDHY